MVGLSTAWFLQEHGLHVTVYERRHVAAGSSWGNAGWLTPALTAPLPEPAVLTYGVHPAQHRPSVGRRDPRVRADEQRGTRRVLRARRWGCGVQDARRKPGVLPDPARRVHPRSPQQTDRACAWPA
jgi:D-amino-acid dehydrogenase